MKKRTKNIVRYGLGALLLGIGILAIFNSIFLVKAPQQILWLSYIMLLLMGIGILSNNSYLINACLNIMIIPYLFWTIDFFHILITGNALFGITDYFFEPGPLIGKLIGSQHLFSFIIGLFALYLIKIEREDAWKLSFFILSIMFLFSLAFAPPELNVNCVFEPCLNVDISPKAYPFAWFGVLFLMSYITNLFIRNVEIFKSRQTAEAERRWSSSRN